METRSLYNPRPVIIGGYLRHSPTGPAWGRGASRWSDTGVSSGSGSHHRHVSHVGLSIATPFECYPYGCLLRPGRAKALQRPAIVASAAPSGVLGGYEPKESEQPDSLCVLNPATPATLV
jgi:hypothetical protein